MSASPFNPVSNQEGGENVHEGVWVADINHVALYETPPDAPPSPYGDAPRVQWKYGLVAPVQVIVPRPTTENPRPKPIEDFLGTEIWDYTSTTMGPRSKARAWCEAAYDRPLAEGETVDPTQLIGRRVVITVGRSQTGRHKITNVMPYREETGRASANGAETAAQKRARLQAELAAAEAEDAEPVAAGSTRADGEPF